MEYLFCVAIDTLLCDNLIQAIKPKRRLRLKIDGKNIITPYPTEWTKDQPAV